MIEAGEPACTSVGATYFTMVRPTLRGQLHTSCNRCACVVPCGDVWPRHAAVGQDGLQQRGVDDAAHRKLGQHGAVVGRVQSLAAVVPHARNAAAAAAARAAEHAVGVGRHAPLLREVVRAVLAPVKLVSGAEADLALGKAREGLACGHLSAELVVGEELVAPRRPAGLRRGPREQRVRLLPLQLDAIVEVTQPEDSVEARARNLAHDRARARARARGAAAAGTAAAADPSRCAVGRAQWEQALDPMVVGVALRSAALVGGEVAVDKEEGSPSHAQAHCDRALVAQAVADAAWYLCGSWLSRSGPEPGLGLESGSGQG